ncbi:MAG TPA: hypothetical protein VF556_01895 [Pyrinomonadaceae bacterium]|jgi:hypothetical protein
MPENVNLKHDVILDELFKKLGLKPNQRQLIRAFISASKGEKQFEVSRAELAQILFDDNSTKFKANKEKVGYWFDVLQKWQETNGLVLIKMIERGYREETANGRFAFHKPKYEFTVLSEIADLLNSKQENLEANLESAVLRLKQQYKPSEKPKQYHPRHLRKKATKTIFTLLKSIFDYSIQVEENPVESCQDVLNDAWEKLNEMEKEWSEQRNRQKRISEFEALLDENNADEDEGGLPLKG